MTAIDTSKIPFYSNTDDNLHCFQAGMKMMLGYFLPNRDFSWVELEQMSNKHPGMSTWPQKMLIELDKLGFEVTMIEGFDSQAFIRDGERYLRDTFGSETAEWQIKHSNIPEEQALYQQALERGIQIEHRLPTIEEMKGKLAQGYLVSCTVNSHKLNDKPGYVGHFVVILSISDDGIVLHDPGLPPQANRHVSHEQFQAAWADPNLDATNYIAIRRR